MSAGGEYQEPFQKGEEGMSTAKNAWLNDPKSG